MIIRSRPPRRGFDLRRFDPSRRMHCSLLPGIIAGGGGGVIGGDPFYDDVISLLHLDGSNGSTTFTDEKGITWTASGQAQLATSTPKFGTAAATFDGTTDYIDSAANSGYTFGVDDYTIEAWGRWVDITGNRALFGIGTRTVYTFFNSGSPVLTIFDGSGNQSSMPAGHSLNQYYHVAMCRAAGITRLFRDGTPGADFVDTQNVTANTVSIGRFPGFTNSTFQGFIDEVRVTRRARYTEAFTAPVAPFESFRAALTDPLYQDVVALLNFEGANGRTWFLDERGNKWTRNGSPALTTSQTPGFGTSSLNDTAATDYITTASKAAFGYGTGDFTIEFFARSTNTTGVKIWYDQRNSLNQNRPAIYDAGGGDLRYFVANADRITGGAGVITINTWHHIALCRSGGSTRLFVDGVQVGSTWSDSTNYEASLIVLGQAGDQLGNSFGFIGQYKGLRVTRAARYTANFSPPAALFPNS